MAKIYINSLGPINKFEMDINKLNLFIGEQATGKSTISKSIYFFRTLKGIFIEYLYKVSLDGKQENGMKFPQSIRAEIKSYFVELFGYSWNLPDSLQMKYEYNNDCNVRVQLQKRKDGGKNFLSIDFSSKLEKDMQRMEQEMIDFNQSAKDSSSNFVFVTSERLRVHEDINRKVSNLLSDDKETYYIPAGRSLMTLMTNQKTKLDYSTMDLINRKFMQFIESIQTKFDMGIGEAYKYFPVGERKFDVNGISANLIKGLKGDYCYASGREYLRLKNSDERIPINFTSSGQQEVLWLLNQLYILMLRAESSFVIIEEPEAHLYPTLQKQVVEFIVQFSNLTNSNVIITTHSPYVLTCLNNLLYAGNVKTAGNVEKVEKIVGKNKMVNRDEFYACKLSRVDDKTQFIDLVEGGSGEIAAELIDEVSDEVNQMYTELFYLEE